MEGLAHPCPSSNARRILPPLHQTRLTHDEVEWGTPHCSDHRRPGQRDLSNRSTVEVPKDWSMTATNIVASKYLHGTS